MRNRECNHAKSQRGTRTFFCPSINRLTKTDTFERVFTFHCINETLVVLYTLGIMCMCNCGPRVHIHALKKYIYLKKLIKKIYIYI